MRSLRASTAFRKDLKRIARRGYDLARLERVIQTLQSGAPLAAVHRPHPLKGEWVGHFECHVQADWLLIYKLTDVEVRLARTGTHSDLFED